MPVSAAVRARCRALLPPGDEIDYVFPATAASPDGTPAPRGFLIVVTARSVTVLSTRDFGRREPAAVWAVHPRRTRLGPVEFSPAPTIELGGSRFEVDEEYAAVVGAADAEVFSPGDLPHDPLPDL